jgi:signal transduction histidine kinase
MITNSLLKRTTVRLAGAFTLLFVLLVVVLIAILYTIIGAELASNIRERVQDTSDALVAIDAERGFEELSAIVANEARSVRNLNSIFLLRRADGSFQAGNVKHVAVFDGWRHLDRSALPLVAEDGRPDDRFFAIWREVSGGHLLVGRSDRQIREVRRVFLHGLGWGLATAVLLAGTFAMLMARRAQQRIDDFATTLEKVGQGDIRTRVPLTGSMDDLDHVAGQVNATLDHLQTLIENVNQASSDIAHDLKKPIGRLRRGLEQALQSAEDVADFRRRVAENLTELDVIVATFEALLRISQIEAGARKLRFETIDLGGVLGNLAEIYAPVAEESGKHLVLEVECDGATLLGDRELLTQLFANLIENAILHSGDGTHIGVSLSTQAGNHVAAVWDGGPGIPPEERKNVFRRLYRLQKSRTTPGSGLGLTLVAAIAELHGAAIELEDNGPGLRIRVAFPAAQPLSPQIS